MLTSMRPSFRAGRQRPQFQRNGGLRGKKWEWVLLKLLLKQVSRRGVAVQVSRSRVQALEDSTEEGWGVGPGLLGILPVLKPDLSIRNPEPEPPPQNLISRIIDCLFSYSYLWRTTPSFRVRIKICLLWNRRWHWNSSWRGMTSSPNLYWCEVFRSLPGS